MANHRLTAIAALLAGLAVALGAFAAHGMKDYPPADLVTFEKAVRYQMYHALALLALPALRDQGIRPRLAAPAFLAGIVLFSGSLYLLVWTNQRWLGAVTPFGGIAFLLGWAALAHAAWRARATH